MYNDSWEHSDYKGYATLWGASEAMLLACLMELEAGGEGLLGQHGVLQVVINRLHDQKKRFGNTLHEVMLRKYAFSCFNPDGLEKAVENIKTLRVANSPSFSRVGSFLDGTMTCPVVEKATHYLNIALTKKLNHGELPNWVKTLKHIVTLGKHDFYEEA